MEDNRTRMQPVELSVAADRAMMLIIRLTTAGVVTRAGLTIDAMDSLKMAAEEACACLMTQDCAAKRLVIRYECVSDALIITVRVPDAFEGTTEIDDAEMDVMRCILESLADEVHFEFSNGWIQAIELRTSLLSEG